ncbi:MAG: DNA starvation/stationary phase protection protein [Anaerolineae bacterium]|nr:DNA starvation/stationary phase protection protein [Anaerolineae bacterium]
MATAKAKVPKPTATKTKSIKPDLGLNDEQQQIVVNILKPLLADETVLYIKLRNFHWNVTGPQFQPLHALFENQYDELADIIDEVAERIRQHGENAPGTLVEFQKLARLTEQPGVYPDARTMIANALADHEALVRQIRQDIDVIDDDADEAGSEDLLTGILQKHQKMAWMLRAHLEGQ